MDSMLAMKFLEWENLQRQADAVKKEIVDTILSSDEPKTEVVGNVRATYSQGRKKYDYEEACKHLSPASLVQFVIRKIDWKAVCEAKGIKDIPYTQSEPSVTLKLTE